MITKTLNKLIYIKYGELFLKKKNKHLFINVLKNNLQNALKKLPVQINIQYDYIFVTCEEKYINKTVNIILLIPGISYVIVATKLPRDEKILMNELVNLIKIKKCKTFAVQTKRVDKRYPINSMEFSKKIGSDLIDLFPNLKVDLTTPELLINLEIKNDSFILYIDKKKGEGGFPVGINGRVLLLLSGGIDSPVAAKLLLKKGYHVDFITYLTPPHTSPKLILKIKKLVKQVSMNGILQHSALHIINFTNIQHELAHTSDKSYQIILMRRCFFKIAKQILLDKKYDALATGESLGQVASQTIDSIKTTQNAIPDVLVLRPLLTYDKSEIIELAKHYNTYNISIEQEQDCCILFVPSNPVTKPSIERAIKLENEIELLQPLMNKANSKYTIYYESH